MISTIIYKNIFQDNERAQEIAASYAVCGQEEIGLDWIGNYNYALGCALAQHRVFTDPETSVELLIDLIQEYVDGDFTFADLNLNFVGQKHISIDVVRTLCAIIDMEPCSEVFFYERIFEVSRNTDAVEDAVHLKPL